jgi:thioester reductase-like protein
VSGYVLLSGATGLLGRYLVRDLLMAGHRLAILQRPSQREGCRERLEQTLQFWENQGQPPLPRPVCIEGDVSKPGLGLSEADQRWIAEHCDRFLHNAASLTFVNPDRLADPWQTNLNGVEYVLDCCRRLGIADLHHVSTAYVCGLREGVIREDQLEAPPRFRNDYEHSKFLAEQLVRKAADDDGLRVTIYRPVVILGDSQTGYTASYHGAYLYLRLMSVILRQETPEADGRILCPVRLNLTGDELRNAVPVDWVSRVMVHLFDTPEAHGRTFHIASDQRIVSREFVEHGLSYFNAYGVEFRPVAQPYSDRISRIDAMAHENIGIYEEYQQTDPTFDTTNLKQFAGHIECPVVDREMIARFVQYGEADNWGKRRPPKARVGKWAEDLLLRCLGEPGQWTPSEEVGQTSEPADLDLVGLDLVGPGGGQWHFVLRDDRLLGYDRGLPPTCGDVIRLPAAEFVARLEPGHVNGGDWLQDGVTADGIAPARRLVDALSGRLTLPTAGSCPS